MESLSTLMRHHAAAGVCTARYKWDCKKTINTADEGRNNEEQKQEYADRRGNEKNTQRIQLTWYADNRMHLLSSEPLCGVWHHYMMFHVWLHSRSSSHNSLCEMFVICIIFKQTCWIMTMPGWSLHRPVLCSYGCGRAVFTSSNPHSSSTLLWHKRSAESRSLPLHPDDDAERSGQHTPSVYALFLPGMLAKTYFTV